MNKYKILAINPGSTSTKVAVFENDACILSENISHDADELKQFDVLSDQLPYRRDMILSWLDEKGVDLESIDVFVGRGGGLIAMEGGTYEVTPLVREHARTCANGVIHPASLGPQLAYDFADKYEKRAMVINPPDVDELQEKARLTGIRGVNRVIHLHALNLKETAIRHSTYVEKKPYDKCRYIVCHIGGGISVSAHKNGKMIDGFDIVGGEGPMAPTRCGSVAVMDLLNFMEKQKMSAKDMKAYCTKKGGMVSHCGTSDVLKLLEMAEGNDEHARLVWESMLYQIIKCIGAMSAVLEGKVDAVLLGGGIVHSRQLVDYVTRTCSYIAPVYAYPGEFEMEAMAAGALRVLNGEEQLKVYTGKPVWAGFPWDR